MRLGIYPIDGIGGLEINNTPHHMIIILPMDDQTINIITSMGLINDP